MPGVVNLPDSALNVTALRGNDKDRDGSCSLYILQRTRNSTVLLRANPLTWGRRRHKKKTSHQLAITSGSARYADSPLILGHVYPLNHSLHV
jgi:hypothetical protein